MLPISIDLRSICSVYKQLLNTHIKSEFRTTDPRHLMKSLNNGQHPFLQCDLLSPPRICLQKARETVQLCKPTVYSEDSLRSKYNKRATYVINSLYSPFYYRKCKWVSPAPLLIESYESTTNALYVINNLITHLPPFIFILYSTKQSSIRLTTS